MMNNLLSKPFKAFTLYALVILACSIPVYYVVVNYIWMEELDEHNKIVRDQIVNRITLIDSTSSQFEEVLQLWNTLQPGVTLTPTTSPVTKDSVYEITRVNEYVTDETDRYRGLLTGVRIRNKAYVLQIETNVEESDETILAISIVTLLFVILLVVGFIVLNKRIAKNIWKPFYDTLEKLKSFDLLSAQPISFSKSTIAEFEELNSVLQKLIDSNITAFSQQKTFIENASHELQTPLAVLKSKADMLLQDPTITAHQAEMLHILQTHLAKVTRINKNLLLLARIENSQFAESETLNIAEILQESLTMLDNYTGNRKVTFTAPENATFFVSGNKFLAETMVNNLLTNAIKHSPAESDLTIELRERTLFIYNNGTAALDRDKLFKRYSISSSEHTNSGLGLAIVKEITKHYRWVVGYNFENNKHCFWVQF